MSGDRLALILIAAGLLIVGAAVVAYIIGWNMGYGYGQSEMCDQMAYPWQWAECR